MMKDNRLETIAIAIMVFLFFFVGFAQSWSLSLSILNMCIISAVMSMGINMQWGYAGIFNVGIMGFTALGGLAAVLVSYSPVGEAWRVGGLGMAISLFLLIAPHNVHQCNLTHLSLTLSSFKNPPIKFECLPKYAKNQYNLTLIVSNKPLQQRVP